MVRNRKVYRPLPREVPDDLWEVVEGLIPEEPPKPEGGRPRVDDRRCLNGILFVLRSGCRWKDLPPAYSSGSTCHLRLTQWTRAGVWEILWSTMLEFLAREGKLDLKRCGLDTAQVPAPRGARKQAPALRIGANPAAREAS